MSRNRPRIKLSESVYGDALKVDRDAGVIRGVKILGRESKNGRTYSDRAMREAATLYEGRKVNIDHMMREGSERPFRDVFGELRNVHMKEGAVYGDLHFLKSHPLAEQVCEAAERFPTQFGLSHDAEGRTARQGGKLIVESVIAVHSVDLVNTPATNAGLFESVASTGKDRRMKIKLRELVESLDHKVYRARLQEMDPGVGDYTAEMPEESADMSAEDQIDSAFRAMVMAVYDDGSLDDTGKLAKIKQLLQTKSKLTTGAEPATETAPTTEGDKAEKAMAESFKKIQEKLDAVDAFLLRESCRSLIEAAGKQVTPERVELLAKAADDNARAKLVESWPGAAIPVKKPGQVNLKEAVVHPSHLQSALKSPEDFVRALHS